MRGKIHMLDLDYLCYGQARYACIGAVYPKEEKITTEKNKVTCKNCQRVIKIFELEERI